MRGLQMLGGCAAALLLETSVHADPAPNPLEDRFQVAVGAFSLTSEPVIQLNGDDASGDRVHWHRRFGRMDAERLRIEGNWRFAGRHKIRAIAFSLSRDRAQVLDKSIEWGGETYPIDSAVRAELSFEILEVAYEYAFVRGARYELGASIGLHYTSLDASLEAKAIDSSGTLSGDLSESATLDTPLPVIGIGGTWSLSRSFWLDASAQFFALSVDEYEGHLRSYRAALTWQPKSWLGIGVGYHQFSVDMEVANEDLNGALDWRYAGPMLFYRASF
jgi:hypothetical protein